MNNIITVSQLKKLIKDWAEIDENGEPTEVWIETGRNLSSPVVNVARLNNRNGIADMLLESGVFNESTRQG